MLADKLGRKKKEKRQILKCSKKINWVQLRNKPLDCSTGSIKYIHRNKGICKLIAVQICLQLLINARDLQGKYLLCAQKLVWYGAVPGTIPGCPYMPLQAQDSLHPPWPPWSQTASSWSGRWILWWHLCSDEFREAMH